MSLQSIYELTDEQIVNLYAVKPPAEIAKDLGLTAKQKAYLQIRASKLRRQGWDVKRWPGPGVRFKKSPG